MSGFWRVRCEQCGVLKEYEDHYVAVEHSVEHRLERGNGHDCTIYGEDEE